MNRPDTLREEVEGFFSDYDRHWNGLSLAAILSDWTPEDIPIYLGEEYADPIVGWDNLREHLGRVETRVRSMRITSEIHEVKLVAPDVALTLISTRWTMETVESTVPRSGESWVTVVLRRQSAKWRLLHYAESPR